MEIDHIDDDDDDTSGEMVVFVGCDDVDKDGNVIEVFCGQYITIATSVGTSELISFFFPKKYLKYKSNFQERKVSYKLSVGECLYFWIQLRLNEQQRIQ